MLGRNPTETPRGTVLESIIKQLKAFNQPVSEDLSSIITQLEQHMGKNYSNGGRRRKTKRRRSASRRSRRR